MTDREKRYEDARRRARKLRGFYRHLIIFIVVNAALILLNFITSAGKLWFYMILFPWAIVLAIHFIVTFDAFGFFGKDWEERKTRQLMGEDDEDEDDDED